MRSLLIFICSIGLLLAAPTKEDEKLDAQMNDALFGLSLTALKEGNKPAVLSPFSVAMALATVNDGAKDKTSQEITDVAFHGISKEKVASWFKAKLAVFKEDYSPLSKTLNVLEGYITDVKDNFFSKIEKVDFAAEPQVQRKKINDFVNETTAGHIPELLKEDHVKSQTRLIAVNALYQKSAFKSEFSKDSTAKKAFNNEDKSTKEIDTMTGTHKGRFFENDDFAYGDMPFNDWGFHFFIIIPKSNSLASIKEKFIAKTQKFSGALGGAKGFMYLHVTVPKFNVSSELEFKDILEKAGIKQVFESAANLKGISSEPLYVEYLIHKAVLELDEKGVTAAAASGIGIMPLSAQICTEDCHRTIKADRPFLFGVAHHGTPIFVGHYY
ncbi:hypothetical protein QR680_004158 [Steinernema hermaphroditum]|uniref:Serpin domain-containing protein n=1 Tax=Steinernema hermaphroditum TaxID=289476 RepID=A0AA39HMU0_9BILA|nr:hypothetical protein QR680_004158 [Steinernema hermaphroditum]